MRRRLKLGLSADSISTETHAIPWLKDRGIAYEWGLLMNPEHAQKILVQTAREKVRRCVSETLQVVTTGKVKEVANPFTGKPMAVPAPKHLATVAAKFAKCGLDKDAEFMSAFQKLSHDLAATPVFDLFSALDGEGDFAEGGVLFEIHASGVGVIPTGLHEDLFPIDGDLLKA
ncbi:MAG: hypothetical protein KGS45_08260 [Planctomycetes bacterium]|nr:hypothetical protein [Planctomycetota bacterium]